MGLLEQQNLMARLYMDEALRRDFLADPNAVSQLYGLSDDETAELADVLPDELNFFASSLLVKRLREIEHMLPITKKALGAEFTDSFHEYNIATTTARELSRAQDALEFCRYIEQSQTGETVAAARFERQKRQFFASERHFVFTRFEGRRFIWLRIAGRVIQRSF